MALLEQARQLAEGNSESWNKAWALHDIAGAYAKLGMWRQARQTAALNITDEGRVQALTAILEAWAEH
jgi:hypothetical protein